MSLLCVVCMSLLGQDVEAITVVNGTAVCRSHIITIGLPRRVSMLINKESHA
jgi:hypothetical protein